jgi:ABC-type Mn2+/Zn2+ transport system permease subunit
MVDTGRLWAAGRGLAVALLAVALVLGLVADGRLRTVALAVVPAWLLVGLLVVSGRHARTTGRLPHHLVFAGIVIGGSAVGTGAWTVANGVLPDVAAAVVSLCVWTLVVWAGRRFVYRGPFDRLAGVCG